MTKIQGEIMLLSVKEAQPKGSHGNHHSILKVTKLTVKPRVLTLAESNQAIENIDKSIKLAKSCLEIGTFVFKDVAPELKAIIGVGTIIQSVLAFAPHPIKEKRLMPKNPMEEKIGHLEKHLEQLGEKMTSQFDDLKIFVTETNFSCQVVIPTSILMRFMRDCMKHPAQESIDNFRMAYAKHSPLDLIYTIMCLLEQNSTNPFRMTMETEEIKTSESFKKWEVVIDGLVGQFLFIEGFASGLLKHGNKDESRLLTQKVNEVFKTINEVKSEYGMQNQGYWEEMKKYLDDNIEDFHKMDQKLLADKIRDKLETYLTNDAFYILSNEWYYDRQNVVFKNYEGDNSCIFWQCANRNTIIYRSRYAYSASLEELEKMKKDTQALKSSSHSGNPEMPEKIVNDRVINAGFMILIGGDVLEIRSANCPRRKYGPGWWTVPSDFGANVKQTLLVGFR